MLKFVLLCIVIFVLLCINATSKLWVEENIGEVTDLFYNKKANVAYVSTKQGVIASIDVENNGNIIWRQVFDKQDIINQFEMSLDKKSLISLSNGNVLRKWKKIDGSLLWESRQFIKQKENININININNADMQILESNKIILVDNFDILSVYDQDEGTLIWKQSLNLNNNNNKTHKHKIYAHEKSKIVYIVNFYTQYVIVESYSLITGEFMKSASKYQHECSSLPSQFEVLDINDINDINDIEEDLSLIIWYDCSPNDVTPLYAFLFSIAIDLHHDQITPLSVSFDIVKPQLKKWKLNKHPPLTLSAQYCQLYDIKTSIKSKSVQLISSQKECPKQLSIKYRGKIKNIWKSNSNSNSNSNSITILNDDGSLCFNNNNNNNKWCREESLASPLFVYLFDESEDESSLCSQDMSEEECDAVFNAPFPSFPKRLFNDITSLLGVSIAGITGGFNYNMNELIMKLNTYFPITSAWLDVTFEKIITILTKSGKLFGISSAHGNILWSINLKYLCGDYDDYDYDYEIITMLAIRQHPPHLLAILSDKQLNKSKIISISSPFHTKETPHIHIESVDYYIQNAFVTPYLSKEHGDKITILIERKETKETIHTYPFNVKINMNSIFYHTLADNILSGYSIAHANAEIIEIWRKSFSDSNEEIVDVVFSSHDQFVVNSVYRTGERGAIYKYLNPHLIGVATISKKEDFDHDLFHIYLMDGITGRIYLHEFHDYVERNGGISLLLYENKFVYTFFNKHSLLSELHSIDLWQSNPLSVPSKGRTPSEGYIVNDNPLQNNIFSSFNAPLPYMRSQAYNFELSIDKLLCVSNTRYSVSNRLILAKLSSGSIIQIDNKWLNTRRPITHEPTQANKEEQLIPYKKNIPFSNLWSLSHSNTLNRISNAISVGTPIESTSLFFAYGNLDLFYTLLTPSKNFDTIPPDFDYPMLVIILSGVVVAIIVAKKMVQSKKIKKEWK